MAEWVHAVLWLAGLLFVVGASGAALTFGVASVCHWMKWAPINITLNVTRDEP